VRRGSSDRERALALGLEAAAREAFDAALDVDVESAGTGHADPDSRPLTALWSSASTRRIAFFAGKPASPVEALRSMTRRRPRRIVDRGAPVQHPRGPVPDRDGTPPRRRQSNEAVLGREVIDLPSSSTTRCWGRSTSIPANSTVVRTAFARPPHLPRIREILAEGIPRTSHVPIVESAFNPTALSRRRRRASGTPLHGKQYGLKQDFFVDERSNMRRPWSRPLNTSRTHAMFGD
jgi:hypothetical protein